MPKATRAGPSDVGGNVTQDHGALPGPRTDVKDLFVSGNLEVIGNLLVHGTSTGTGGGGGGGGGSGDVTGPSSATDGGIVVFDGTTGKAIKAPGAAIAVGQKLSSVTDPTSGQDAVTKAYHESHPIFPAGATRIWKPFWEAGFSSSGSPDWAVDTGDFTDGNFGGGYYVSTTNGSWIQFSERLAAGTWEFWVLGPHSTGYGILELSIDGAASGTGPTVDLYAAALHYNRGSAFSATVNIATSGLHAVRLTIAGKNASSGGFGGLFNVIGGHTDSAVS